MELHFQYMAILKALKHKSCLSLGTCHKHVVQFTEPTLTFYWYAKRNKRFYTRVEHGRIRWYTVHTGIREYTDTHSVSVWIKSRILLYSIYPGKYCALFEILSMKYAIVIPRFRVRYDQCFPSLSYFAGLFHEPLGEWNNSKIWETRKILAILWEINMR